MPTVGAFTTTSATGITYVPATTPSEIAYYVITDTINITPASGSINLGAYLIGSGGGGSSAGPGGAGNGGCGGNIITCTSLTFSATNTYSITIGAGGTIDASNNAGSTTIMNYNQSSFLSISGTTTDAVNGTVDTNDLITLEASAGQGGSAYELIARGAGGAATGFPGTDANGAVNASGTGSNGIQLSAIARLTNYYSGGGGGGSGDNTGNTVGGLGGSGGGNGGGATVNATGWTDSSGFVTYGSGGGGGGVDSTTAAAGAPGVVFLYELTAGGGYIAPSDTPVGLLLTNDISGITYTPATSSTGIAYYTITKTMNITGQNGSISLGIYAIGGGGGGSFAGIGEYSGCGGNGGSITHDTSETFSSSTVYEIYIGAGGIAGAGPAAADNNSNYGGTGGNTSITGKISATGGAGGIASSVYKNNTDNDAMGNFGAGGSGAAGSGATSGLGGDGLQLTAIPSLTNYYAGGGGGADASTNSAAGSYGGNGGTSGGNGGYSNGQNPMPGVAGQTYGSGGGGGSSTAIGTGAANGAQGVIFLYSLTPGEGYSPTTYTVGSFVTTDSSGITYVPATTSSDIAYYIITKTINITPASGYINLGAYLIGSGGGGSSAGGGEGGNGGNGGGIVNCTSLRFSATNTYSITIGAGGAIDNINTNSSTTLSNSDQSSYLTIYGKTLNTLSGLVNTNNLVSLVANIGQGGSRSQPIGDSGAKGESSNGSGNGQNGDRLTTIPGLINLFYAGGGGGGSGDGYPATLGGKGAGKGGGAGSNAIGWTNSSGPVTYGSGGGGGGVDGTSPAPGAPGVVFLYELTPGGGYIPPAPTIQVGQLLTSDSTGITYTPAPTANGIAYYTITKRMSISTVSGSVSMGVYAIGGGGGGSSTDKGGNEYSGCGGSGGSITHDTSETFSNSTIYQIFIGAGGIADAGPVAADNNSNYGGTGGNTSITGKLTVAGGAGGIASSVYKNNVTGNFGAGGSGAAGSGATSGLGGDGLQLTAIPSLTNYYAGGGGGADASTNSAAGSYGGNTGASGGNGGYDTGNEDIRAITGRTYGSGGGGGSSIILTGRNASVAAAGAQGVIFLYSLTEGEGYTSPPTPSITVGSLLTTDSSGITYTPATSANGIAYYTITNPIRITTLSGSISLGCYIIGGGGAGSSGSINSLIPTAGNGGNGGVILTCTSLTFSNTNTYSILIGTGGVADYSDGGSSSISINSGNLIVAANSVSDTLSSNLTPPFTSLIAQGGLSGQSYTTTIISGGGGTGAGAASIYYSVGADGIQLTNIPSITQYYSGGGGSGAGGFSVAYGGNNNESGGYGGNQLTIPSPGITYGSGGGGGNGGGPSYGLGQYQENQGGNGANGKKGVVILYELTPGGGYICFLAGTPVETDQGEVAIDKINTQVNTINGRRILAITSTPGEKDCLFLIKKDLIDKNIPNKDTVISRWHMLLYKGGMEEAQNIPGANPFPYKGEILYNVLMDEHEDMKVNGLTVETLNPDHEVAKFYRKILNIR